jgi:hypothetical protein
MSLETQSYGERALLSENSALAANKRYAAKLEGTAALPAPEALKRIADPVAGDRVTNRNSKIL